MKLYVIIVKLAL